MFNTLTFEGTAGGTAEVCCFGGWEGVREREEGEQGVEEKEKRKRRGGEGRGVRSKCYLLTTLNMYLAYNNALYLVTFCLCSCRENGKDVKDDNRMVTNISISVNHNWTIHCSYHRVIPCYIHLGNPSNS